MRTLAVGDIHGSTTALDALLAAVRLKPADRLVFLGDYVDRGPDTRGTLDRLIAIREKMPNAVFLRGNHELMMTRARHDRGERKMWLSVGGSQALASYGPGPGRSGTIDDVPEEHWTFLEDHLVDYIETDTHIFVHANLAPTVAPADQSETMLFWEFLKEPIRHVSGKTVVVGHSSQRTGVPLDFGDTVCIDTYAYGGGWLTCLDVGTRTFWQADVMGRVREGQLAEPEW